MNKKMIFWTVVTILVISSIASALTEAEQSQMNSLFNEYKADRETFKANNAKKSQLARFIKIYLAEKYEEEAAKTEDQARLERMQQIINQLDLPADKALKIIKQKKEGIEEVHGDVDKKILFEIRPIPETNRVIYGDTDKDLFVGVQITPLTQGADMTKLVYKWTDGTLEKKYYTDKYLVRKAEKGIYNIKLELYYKPTFGKEYKINEKPFEWEVNIGGELSKTVMSPKFMPSKDKIILVKGESREFIVDFDNIAGKEITYTWTVDGTPIPGETSKKFILDKCPSKEEQESRGCIVSVTPTAPGTTLESKTWTISVEPEKTLQELFPTKEIVITSRQENKVSFRYVWDIPGNFDELKKDFEILNKYQWDFDGDGNYDSTTSTPTASFDYSQKPYGNYVVRVKVPVVMKRVGEDREYSTEIHYSYSQTVVEGAGKSIEEEDIAKILSGTETRPEEPTELTQPKICSCIKPQTGTQIRQWSEDDKSCVTEWNECSEGCGSAEDCAGKCWPVINRENEEKGYKAITENNKIKVGYIAAKTATQEDCIKLGQVEPPTGEGPRLDSAGKITNIGSARIYQIKDVKEKNQDTIWIKYSSLPTQFTTSKLISGIDYKINPVGKWIEIKRGIDTTNPAEYYFNTAVNSLKLRATAKDGDMIAFTAPADAIKIDDASIRTRAEKQPTDQGDAGTTTAPSDCNTKLTEMTKKILSISIMKMTDKTTAKATGEALIKDMEQFKKDCATNKNLVKEADKMIQDVKKIIK